MKKQTSFAWLAVCLMAAAMATGCSSGRTETGTADSAASSAADPAADETTTAPETTTSATTTTTTETTTTTAETVTTAPATSAVLLNTSPVRQDADTKMLWSERGLEIVPLDSEDGYGAELKAGETYLDWTLQSFDGFPNDAATEVSELHADFTYNNGALSVNGIMQILPADHPAYPNGFYLRVDNQADFPYFPKDSRERGKFIIANAGDVRSMLGLDEMDSLPNELAVSVSVTTLHVHYSADGYDTIQVTAASKR